MKNRVDAKIYLHIQGNKLDICHALEKFSARLYQEYRDAAVLIDDLDDADPFESMGSVEIKAMVEIRQIIEALKEFSPIYDLYIKGGTDTEGFTVSFGNTRICAECFRDSDKVLAGSREKIAAAITLLGEI